MPLGVEVTVVAPTVSMSVSIVRKVICLSPVSSSYLPLLAFRLLLAFGGYLPPTHKRWRVNAFLSNIFNSLKYNGILDFEISTINIISLNIIFLAYSTKYN